LQRASPAVETLVELANIEKARVKTNFFRTLLDVSSNSFDGRCFARRNGAHRIAVTQERACAQDDKIAFRQSLADLNSSIGRKSSRNRTGLDVIVSHDLHDGSLIAVEDRG
jgi:hypothetical protein